MRRIQNFINGEFQESKSGKYMPNYKPATGEVLCEQPDSDALDVVAAVQAAHKAFEKWRHTPVKERAAILNKIADLMDERREQLARAESDDQGKPWWLSYGIEIPRAASNFRFFAAKILTQQDMSAEVDDKAINYVIRQPIGVGGLISPWNLPLVLFTWKLAPCIAFGNTAVSKPSELTPLTAFMMAEIVRDAGLPPGVCNLIFGRGDPAGAAIVKHPGVGLISFTGGTVTGAKIQEMTASSFKKVSFELGGKNANIVFKDADLETALETTVRSSFQNSGQICLCGSRLYVQEEIYGEFVGELKKRTDALVVGDPRDEKTFMGPVISKEHLAKIQAHVAQAQKDGGRISAGAVPLNLPDKFKNGYFMRPTIIEEMSNCSDIWQTEIFGPVVTVKPFKSTQDAVRMANASSYGLSASLWTKDVSRAHKVAAALETGTVWINSWMLRDLRVPFGGWKASGLGREGGDHSLDFYTEAKTICVGLS